MIVGSLSDLPRHKAVLPAVIVRAIEAVQNMKLDELPPGRYELEGEALFVLIQDATPREIADSLSEAHRSHADVQIPVGASECFGFALPQADLHACDDRLDSHDLAFYPTPANECFIDIEPGSYIVFLPGELHRPSIAINDKTPFRKAVIKVHTSLLGL